MVGVKGQGSCAHAGDESAEQLPRRFLPSPGQGCQRPRPDGRDGGVERGMGRKGPGIRPCHLRAESLWSLK